MNDFFNFKSGILISLLALSIIAKGQDLTVSEKFLYEGDPINYYNEVYYKAVPGRFFIQKNSDVSQNYIFSLINELTDSLSEISWSGDQDNFCRVLIHNDVLIDSIIDKLLKNDSVLIANRIYVKKEQFDKYVAFLQLSDVNYTDYFNDPNLKNKEIWFFNDLLCYPYENNPNTVPIDSICDAFGLESELSGTMFKIKASKNTDIFEVAHKLFETKYFMRVDVNKVTPFGGMIFDNIYGYKVNSSEDFFIYTENSSKGYYYEIPDRIFLQKSQDVTKDYINALLSRCIDKEFDVCWFNDNCRCRIVIDGELADSVIDELLKDAGVMLARYIYVTKADYNKYLFYPELERYEQWISNQINCHYNGDINQIPVDSLSNSLGLTIEKINESPYYSYVVFKTSKNADIFKISQKLFETGFFTSARPLIEAPFNSWTDVKNMRGDVLQTVYYDMTGKETVSPSGLTIVVTHYYDGSIKTEKIIYIE